MIYFLVHFIFVYKVLYICFNKEVLYTVCLLFLTGELQE